MSLDFALNHVTVARAPFKYLLEIAQGLGCIGVELRTDLSQPIFDGLPAAQAGAMCRDRGLRILALAEVARFNAWSAEKAKEALSLIETAKAAGAEAINLIPRSDKGGMNEGERQANLRIALRELRPMLEDHGLRGFVEPLGFKISALRFKQEAVDVIEALDAARTFSLVHDTFHHHLAHSGFAEEGPIFPEHTGIVHASGVVDQRLATNEMQDAHRTLVDDRDRVGNLDQMQALRAAHYTGPISIEAFAPDLHAIEDPVPALRASMDFMRANLKAQAA